MKSYTWADLCGVHRTEAMWADAAGEREFMTGDERPGGDQPDG